MAREKTPRRVTTNIFNNIRALQPGQIITLKEQRQRLAEIQRENNSKDLKNLELDVQGYWTVPVPQGETEDSYWGRFLFDYKRGSVNFAESSNNWITEKLKEAQDRIDCYALDIGNAKEYLYRQYKLPLHLPEYATEDFSALESTIKTVESLIGEISQEEREKSRKAEYYSLKGYLTSLKLKQAGLQFDRRSEFRQELHSIEEQIAKLTAIQNNIRNGIDEDIKKLNEEALSEKKSADRDMSINELEEELLTQLDILKSKLASPAITEEKKLEIERDKVHLSARLKHLASERRLDNISRKLAQLKVEQKEVQNNIDAYTDLASIPEAIAVASKNLLSASDMEIDELYADIARWETAYKELSRHLRDKTKLQKQAKITSEGDTSPKEISECLRELIYKELQITADQDVGMGQKGVQFSQESVFGLVKTLQQSLYGLHKHLAIGNNIGSENYPRVASDNGYQVIIRRDSDKISITLYTDVMLENGEKRSFRSRFEINIKDLTDKNGRAQKAPIKLTETRVIAPDLATVLLLCEKLDLNDEMAVLGFVRTVLKPYIERQSDLPEKFSALKEVHAKSQILVDKANIEELPKVPVVLIKKIFNIHEMTKNSNDIEVSSLINNAGLSILNKACKRIGNRSQLMADILEQALDFRPGSLLSIDEIEKEMSGMNTEEVTQFESQLEQFIKSLEEECEKLKFKVEEKDAVISILRKYFIKRYGSVMEGIKQQAIDPNSSMRDIIGQALEDELPILHAKLAENRQKGKALQEEQSKLGQRQQQLETKYSATPNILRRLLVTFPFLEIILPAAKIKKELSDVKMQLDNIKMSILKIKGEMASITCSLKTKDKMDMSIPIKINSVIASEQHELCPKDAIPDPTVIEQTNIIVVPDVVNVTEESVSKREDNEAKATVAVLPEESPVADAVQWRSAVPSTKGGRLGHILGGVSRFFAPENLAANLAPSVEQSSELVPEEDDKVVMKHPPKAQRGVIGRLSHLPDPLDIRRMRR